MATGLLGLYLEFLHGYWLHFWCFCSIPETASVWKMSSVIPKRKLFSDNAQIITQKTQPVKDQGPSGFNFVPVHHRDP